MGKTVLKGDADHWNWDRQCHEAGGFFADNERFDTNFMVDAGLRVVF